MKTCYKCGHENADNEIYCRTCGHAFPLSEPKGGASEASPVLGAADEVKAVLRSTEFLLAAAAVTIAVILQMLNVFSEFDDLIEDLFSILANNGIYFRSMASYSLCVFLIKAGCFLCLLLPVALCASMWLLRFGKQDRNLLCGFKIIKIVTIIQIVAAALVAALLVAAGVLGACMASVYGNGGAYFLSFAFMFGTIGIVAAAALTLAIIYYAKMLRFVNSLSGALSGGAAAKNPPNYIIAMNFIAAFFLLSTAFSGEEITFFVCLAGIAYFILLSLCMLKFKRRGN